MEGKRSLADILARSESVMKRSEELKPINSPNVAQEAYHAPQQSYQNYPPQSQPVDYRVYESAGLEVGQKGAGAKNLPPQILAIMEGVTQPTMPLNAVDSGMELFLERKRQEAQQVQQYPTMNEQVVTIGLRDLKDLIKEAVDEAMGKYKKAVEESTIKRTIASLLKEQKKKS